SIEPPEGRVVDVHVGNPFHLAALLDRPVDQAHPPQSRTAVEYRVINVVVHPDVVVPMDGGDFARVFAHQAGALALEGGVLARQVGRRVVFLQVNPPVFDVFGLHRGLPGPGTGNSFQDTMARRNGGRSGEGGTYSRRRSQVNGPGASRRV